MYAKYGKKKPQEMKELGDFFFFKHEIFLS